MTRSKLIESIKSAEYPPLVQAQIISAIVVHWPEGKNMPDISLEGILHFAALVTGVTVKQLKGKRRPSSLVRGRMLYAYFSYRNYPHKFSYKAIGAVINRDHTTIIHSVEQFTNLLYIEDPITVADLKNMEVAVDGGVPKVYREIKMPEIKIPEFYKMVYDRKDEIYFHKVVDVGRYIGKKQSGLASISRGEPPGRFERVVIPHEKLATLNVWKP